MRCLTDIRAPFQQIHFLVRKAAHFVSYGTLGAFAFSPGVQLFPQRVHGSFSGRLWDY